MPHYVVGLDLAASGLKVAVVEVSIRGLVLRRTETLPWLAPTIPEPAPVALPAEKTAAGKDAEPEPLAAVLAESARRLTLKKLFESSPGNEVYVSLDGLKSSLRTLKFPIGDLKKVEAMVGFELEDQLPRDLEEVVYSYVPTLVGREQTEVLVASAAKEEIRFLLDDASAAGCMPRAVYCEALCLLSLASLLGPEPAQQTAVIVDLGEQKTHIALIHQGKPVFARTLRHGGHALDLVLANRFGLSEAEAKRGKEGAARLLSAGTEADSEAKSVSLALVEGLRPLLVHLRQTIHPHAAEFLEAPIYLTGGQALLPGLPAHLGEQLGAKVELLPLPEALRTQPDGHRYSMAYAIAATGTSSPRQPKIDFRKGEFSYRGDLSQLRSQAPALGYSLLVVLILAILSGITRYSVLRSDEKKLDQSLREITKAIMGREIPDFKQALAAMNQAIAPEKSPIPRYSAIDMFAQLSRHIPPELNIHASDIEIRDDHLAVKGEAANFETVDQVIDALKGDDCFKNVSNGKSRKTADGLKVEFNITIDVVCGT